MVWMHVLKSDVLPVLPLPPSGLPFIISSGAHCGGLGGLSDDVQSDSCPQADLVQEWWRPAEEVWVWVAAFREEALNEGWNRGWGSGDPSLKGISGSLEDS